MRQHRPTSKDAHDFIKPFKESHNVKIKEALIKLKVGGTHEEIADGCGLRPDQVWKRLSEIEKDGEIYNTGITRKLKSGKNGIVWQLKEIQKEDLNKWYEETKATGKVIFLQPELF